MFTETQRFRQPWVWLLLGFVFVMASADFIAEPSLINALSSLGIMSGVTLLFWIMKLTVETRADALHVRYAPFYSRTIPYSDIEDAYVEPYSLATYWGWGPRHSSTRGWAYTVSGTKGVRLELSSGESLYLGSKKPFELVSAIQAKR